MFYYYISSSHHSRRHKTSAVKLFEILTECAAAPGHFLCLLLCGRCSYTSIRILPSYHYPQALLCRKQTNFLYIKLYRRNKNNKKNYFTTFTQIPLFARGGRAATTDQYLVGKELASPSHMNAKGEPCAPFWQ